jgi:hypothetical protein
VSVGAVVGAVRGGVVVGIVTGRVGTVLVVFAVVAVGDVAVRGVVVGADV